MVNTYNERKCYDRTVSSYKIIPANYDHNCELWEHDHKENSYISNVMMRNVFNYASTALSTMVAYKYLQSGVYAGHNKDIVLYIALAFTPLVMAQNNVPTKVVDSLYSVSGNDIVASFTSEVNAAIGMVANLPKNIYKLIFSSAVRQENTEQIEVEDDNATFSYQGKRMSMNLKDGDFKTKAVNDNLFGEIIDTENVA